MSGREGATVEEGAEDAAAEGVGDDVAGLDAENRRRVST
jgi:hypothetical protein